MWIASNVDLGLFDLFRLHAAVAAPNCTFGSDLCGNFVHGHSLLAKPLVVAGVARAPDAPGLGVELDEEAVARYTDPTAAASEPGHRDPGKVCHLCSLGVQKQKAQLPLITEICAP